MTGYLHRIRNAIHLIRRHSASPTAQTRDSAWRPASELTERLARDGVVVIPGAMPTSLLRQVRSDIERAWAGDRGILASIPPDATNEPLQPFHRSIRGVRLIDLHWRIESVARAMLAPAVADLLQRHYGSRPTIFQSHLFETSPEAIMHRDDAYLALRPSASLCAVWIALEDVHPGSGELLYIPGSHTLPPYRFGGAREYFTPPLDDVAEHERYVTKILADATSHGLPTVRYLPHAGDAIVWDGRLIHGSARARNRGATRRSLVAHFCPEHVIPLYLAEHPERERREFGPGFLASGYYD